MAVVAAALATTVAGLVVAIPSMFGYNWLVHNLRVHNVELDNFAQEFASRLEAEYLIDELIPAPAAKETTNTGEPQLRKSKETDEQQPELLETEMG